jgi:hypothetical protein
MIKDETPDPREDRAATIARRTLLGTVSPAGIGGLAAGSRRKPRIADDQWRSAAKPERAKARPRIGTCG